MSKEELVKITDKEGLVQIGRLAMRREGDNWNAYYAEENTMDGAIYLGSIRIVLVENDDGLKDGFKDLMRSVVDNVIEGALGSKPEWIGEKPAPEHEKSGNA